MRVHSIEKIEKLKELRRQGYSINELVRELSMPKTTIWHHIHNIQLSFSQRERIKENQKKHSRHCKEMRIKDAEKRAQFLFHSPQRDFIIAIAMLYWGEGHKTRCDFINTDGEMIKVYLWILRNVLFIPEDSFMVTLRIFSGMDESECLKHWSQTTNIPKRKFKIRLNDGMKSGRTKYGMCRIVVRQGGDILKLFHASIKLFAQEIKEN